MSNVDRILETIDHGVGRPISGVANPLNVSSCSRTGCGRRPDAGHDFCAPCLAWLRFESDDDPLPASKTEEAEPPPPTHIRGIPVEEISRRFEEQDWACGI